MNPMLLEIMKLLTSISLSERASEETKIKASQKLDKIMEIVDEEINSAQEHINLMKQQLRERKFGM